MASENAPAAMVTSNGIAKVGIGRAVTDQALNKDMPKQPTCASHHLVSAMYRGGLISSLAVVGASASGLLLVYISLLSYNIKWPSFRARRQMMCLNNVRCSSWSRAAIPT